MDWRLFFTTFVSIFIAELADKTQLVGIGFSARSGKPLLVWLGSVSAYMLVTLISVIVGAVMGKYLNPELIRYSAAAIFIAIGVLMLFKIV